MIIIEHPYHGRDDRVRHVSDSGMMLRQNETGEMYSDAVDIFPCPYTYTETDIPINVEPEELTELFMEEE